jgi:septal ring-binding cell division protein DamX
MSGFREVRKYLIYLCIAGWMFFLGVMAGRGTIPVKIDTREFADRLAEIAQNLSKGKEPAKKLELDFYQGLVNDSVIIEPEEPEPETPEKAGKAPDAKKTKTKTIQQKSAGEQTQDSYLYTIQVAAYQNYKDAVAEVSELEEMGFSPYQEKAQKNGKLWYRVRVGNFASLEHAKIAKTWLSKAGIDSIIIKREQDENKP